jgi:hypothetical protein
VAASASNGTLNVGILKNSFSSLFSGFLAMEAS